MMPHTGEDVRKLVEDSLRKGKEHLIVESDPDAKTGTKWVYKLRISVELVAVEELRA